LRARVRERGITFGASPDGWFRLDPFPRVIGEQEWSELRTGIGQRLRALDAFTADVYGEGRILDAGVVPRWAVETSPHYEPAMRGARVRRWVSIAGLDVVRSPDGRFRVIEDQLRMPSGLAYAVAAREAVASVLPVATPDPDLSPVFADLATALRDAAPEGVDDPYIVVLCEGPGAAGWWEHQRLARAVGAPTVTVADLEHRGGALMARVDGRSRRVDVVYHRTDEDRFGDTEVGRALIEPCRTGQVACVNAPGSGVADDKLLHGYVEEMVRYYLDEESLLPSIPAYPLDDAGARKRLGELVVKPRGEMGGLGVVIWREAGREERQRALRSIESDPRAYVGQELVELSVHPTVCDGRLEPRHVDLRPYALLGDDGVRVLAGGLSRFAPDRGSLVVNSGQGGGAKDTWTPAS